MLFIFSCHIFLSRAQLKRLQTDYDAASQRFCDLSIAHDNVVAQREKDRKQVRIFTRVP